MRTDYTHPLASLVPLSSHQPAFLNPPLLFSYYSMLFHVDICVTSFLGWTGSASTKKPCVPALFLSSSIIPGKTHESLFVLGKRLLGLKIGHRNAFLADDRRLVG